MEKTIGAMGRRELEALGAFEEISEMDRVPLSRKRSSKSPSRKSSPKKTPSKKSSPKKTPRSKSSSQRSEKSSSPLGRLDKRTRVNICRDLNSKPVIEQLGLENLKRNIETAIEKYEDNDYIKASLNRNLKDLNKLIGNIESPITEFCVTDKKHLKIEPLDTPTINNGLKSLLKNRPMGKTYNQGPILNIIMAYCAYKYRHMDICFYNPINGVNFDELENLKIKINFEKGKEEEARIIINTKNEEQMSNFLKSCKKRYVVGFYSIYAKEIESEEEIWHANLLFYDRETGFLQIMEPMGFIGRIHSLPIRYLYNLIGEQMERILPKPYKWKTVNVDFQGIETRLGRELSHIDPIGFCIYWSTWLLEQRIYYLESSSGTDFEKYLEDLRPTLGDLRHFIRGYTMFFNKIYYDLRAIVYEVQTIFNYVEFSAKKRATFHPIDYIQLEKKIIDILVKIYLLVFLT